MAMITVQSGARRFVASQIAGCGRAVQQSEARGASSPFRPIAQASFELRLSPRQIRVRIYAPRRRSDKCGWACRYLIDHPIGSNGAGFGETSVQALFSALRGVSRALYGSAQFKSGRMSSDEESRDLVVPATSDLLGLAPFPF